MKTLNFYRKVSNFPQAHLARDDLSGLIARSRNLTTNFLIDAYTHGIFPWEINENGVFWFSPPERMVLKPEDFHAGKSFQKILKKHAFEVRADCDFVEIMRGCANRKNTQRTWIAPEMIRAYEKLFHLNIAHSVGVYSENVLVGGLYGVQIGALFSGESMFFSVPNASKIALFYLCQNAANFGFSLIDCQIPSPHFLKWGAKIIERAAFLQMIQPLTRHFLPQKWVL